jgi:hypothetical protein
LGEIYDILYEWNEYQSEIGKQIKEAEEINISLPTSNKSSYATLFPIIIFTLQLILTLYRDYYTIL